MHKEIWLSNQNPHVKAFLNKSSPVAGERQPATMVQVSYSSRSG